MQQIFAAALLTVYASSPLHLFIVYDIDVGMLECFPKQWQFKYFENSNIYLIFQSDNHSQRLKLVQ